MATTLATASRNAAANAVTALVGSSGKFRLKSAGGTVIAEVACAATAFGAASNGVASLASTPRTGAGVAAAGAGTVATTFDLTDGANAVVLSGAVGIGTGELQLNNTNIADAQVVTITSFTYTQPA